MKIVELKQKGKSENYIIKFDNNFTYILTLETIVKNNLNLNSEVDDDKFTELIFQDQKITGFEKAINLLTKTFKTEKQIRKYLKEKYYCDDAINYIIEKLKEYRYLNDEEYAKSFISTYKQTKGKLWIKQQLFSKGISEKTINNLLINLESSEEDIEKLIQKFLKGKELNQNTKEKLFRHLLSKGFSYDEIKAPINKIFKGEINEDWD